MLNAIAIAKVSLSRDANACWTRASLWARRFTQQRVGPPMRMRFIHPPLVLRPRRNATDRFGVGCVVMIRVHVWVVDTIVRIGDSEGA
jgi:hypothetical protein